MRDVSIVGAGPVGLFLARELQGLDVKVFEEHQSIGEPVQCSGLVSRNIDELVKIPQECILNKVKGARLYSPAGKCFEVARGREEAYVIDRTLFDQKLSEGVDVETGKRVSSLSLDSEYIVGADGPNSIVAKQSGFPPLEEVIPGLQYEVEKEVDQDFVELHFGNEVAPGFFAWVIPIGDKTRVGLCSKENIKAFLDKFVKSKGFDNAEIVSQQAGLVPLKWREEIVKGNVALVGDAAGQVKPTTGGGIVMGFSSAKILADAIKKGDLDYYTQEWNRKVLPELRTGSAIRRTFKELSDEKIEALLALLGDEYFRKALEEHGDMDKHTKLLKVVIKNPGLLRLVPELMKNLF